MRTILFISHLANLNNGATRALLELIKYTKAQGYKPILILPAEGSLAREVKHTAKVYTIQYDWWMRPLHDKTSYKIADKLNGNAIKQIVQIIRNEKPLVTFTCTSTIPWLAYASSITSTPHAWHLHEHLLKDSPTFTYRLGHAGTLKTIAAMSNKIFTASLSVKRQIESDLHNICDIEVMHPYVPLPEERGQASAATNKRYFTDTSFKAILVGNIEPNKGQLDAVKAVEKVIKENKNITLLLVGGAVSSSYTKEVKSYVKEKGLQKYIKFAGYVDNPYSYVKSADISLVCSAMEAYPLVAIESLQIGTPVIGTNSGGTSEILGSDMSHGLLYKPGNINELARNILSLMHTPDKVETMSQNALKYSKLNSSIKTTHKPFLSYVKKLESSRQLNLKEIDLSPLTGLVDTLLLTEDHVKNLESIRINLEKQLESKHYRYRLKRSV